MRNISFIYLAYNI